MSAHRMSSLSAPSDSNKQINWSQPTDLIIGTRTKYTDFISASNTVFPEPPVWFVNINVALFDVNKVATIAIVGSCKEAIHELSHAPADWQVPYDYSRKTEVVRQTQHIPEDDKLGQKKVIGIVTSFAGP